MILKQLTIEGYKNFKEPFKIYFESGLNILVGENGVGKSAIIDAIRTILQEDEYGRGGIRETDFHRPFDKNKRPSGTDLINITTRFTDLSDEEKIAFLPWMENDDQAKLSLQIANKPTARGRLKRLLWGGVSSSSIFEWELMDTINCIYLPPLRDAEARLCEGRGSRLARLIQNLEKTKLSAAKEAGILHPLEEHVNSFNQEVANDEGKPIARANHLIRQSLQEAVGQIFGQDTRIKFSEISFNRIVENLRLFFFPNIDESTPTEAFRGLEENSLGYNNLIYLATVLAELAALPDDEPEYLRLLLIEEPEAHLHPQLQTRLLKFLNAQAKEVGFQVIVTTHSPVLASAVSIGSLIHLSCCLESQPKAIHLSKCGLSEKSSQFISRWLDATKSVLLFAKGVILVEGIAEALLLPILARKVIQEEKKLYSKNKEIKKLDDAGISIVNMNGIYFKHFMQLFCNINGSDAYNLPVLCSGITDNDPPKDSRPTPSNLIKGNNSALQLISCINTSDYCRLFANPLKTFEYDLAMERGNIKVMSAVLADLWTSSSRTVIPELAVMRTTDWESEPDNSKADASYRLLELIENDDIGKGLFAQSLAEKLDSDSALLESFHIPQYIHNAIKWVLLGSL